MFEQHPVPQQISSYQFRLVGDMTLKQFFQLAAGAVIGLLLYASPLPSLFKWPLIVLFVVAGAAFAFLPLQERPLEEWLSAFFRAVYGPTFFRWKKDSNRSYFANPDGAVVSTAVVPGQVAPTDAAVTKLESKETSFLSNITDMFAPHPKLQVTAVTQPAVASQPLVAPPIAPKAPEVSYPKVISATPVRPLPTTPITPPAPTAGTVFVATPTTSPVATPRVGFVAPTQNNTQASSVTTTPVAQVLRPQEQATSMQAQFSPEAAPPSPATIPNIIVGQVMNAQQKIVEGAILEITDFQGRPVRALKTNKAGHFMIVTPLPNGSYKITIEKDGLVFDPLTFEVHGTIIQPIAIKAKI